MTNIAKKFLAKGAEKAIEKNIDCISEVHIKDLDIVLKGPAIEFHIDATGSISKQDLIDLLNAKE